MGLAFFIFGGGTYNLVMLFRRQHRLHLRYGWEALMDGAARQFVELVVTGYLEHGGLRRLQDVRVPARA